VPLDGSQLDLATSAVDDHGTAKIWGLVSSAALVGLIVWCVIAAAFITWVARMRKQRAYRRSSRAV
jgi:heme/copper-type cytochrome/quinol oxidase subunit 2